MTGIRRLDEVFIFNEKLSFLIPHEWIEAESGEDGTYLYQAPDENSGWFRVSLITIKGVADTAEKLRTLFDEAENVMRNELTGNLIRRSEKDTVQDGEKLHIHYWLVGGIVPPDMVCEAVFSYTVLAENLSRSATQSEIQLLDELVSKARFHAVDDTAPN